MVFTIVPTLTLDKSSGPFIADSSLETVREDLAEAKKRKILPMNKKDLAALESKVERRVEERLQRGVGVNFTGDKIIGFGAMDLAKFGDIRARVEFDPHMKRVNPSISWKKEF